METRQREYPARPILGVGAVVISDGRVLLIRRAAEPLGGQWSLPGGMLEIGENLTDALGREIAEETGLQVRVLDFLEVFEKIEKDNGGRIRYHYVVCDYLCEVAGGTARAGSDASELAWCGQSELTNYGLTEAATRIINKAFEVVGKRKSI